MAIGYVLIGWIIGFGAAITAAIGFDISWLGAFGIFACTSVLGAFVTILWVAWRAGCFVAEVRPPGEPMTVLVDGMRSP